MRAIKCCHAYWPPDDWIACGLCGGRLRVEETTPDGTCDECNKVSPALLAAWQSYCGNPDSVYPCENFKAGWKAGRMDLEGITEQDIAETMPPNRFG